MVGPSTKTHFVVETLIKHAKGCHRIAPVSGYGQFAHGKFLR